MAKILIVEDELAYLRLLNDKLTQKGYQVVEAHNGKEGMETGKKEKPDLILLDIRMPVMDGTEMLKLMRQETWGKKVKVIILTNFEPDDKIMDSMVRYRPSYYCVKSDINFDELLAKIEQTLK